MDCLKQIGKSLNNPELIRQCIEMAVPTYKNTFKENKKVANLKNG